MPIVWCSTRQERGRLKINSCFHFFHFIRFESRLCYCSGDCRAARKIISPSGKNDSNGSRQTLRCLFLWRTRQERLCRSDGLAERSEQARISQVNGVVGSHPIIIFGEITVLCWFAVHIKSVILDFRLFTFMHHEGVSQ